jgi:membrane protease YdiL (CAAX protease family)
MAGMTLESYTAISATSSVEDRIRNRRDLAELVVGYLLILTVIWTPNPAQRVFYWITLAVLILITVRRRESAAVLGLQRAGFLPSLWVVGVAVLLAASAVFMAQRIHTLHSHFGRVALDFHFSGYILWAFVQQFLLQDFFLLRLLRLTSNRSLAVVLAALLFSVAHIPNPILVALTFLWGTIACALFLRYRNLYTLGIAHAILGVCVAITVPNHIQRHMRVGLGYLHYHPPMHHPSAAARPRAYPQ